MKEAIVAKTKELGFDRVGFARAEPLPDAEFADWLRREYHGGMAYMARAPETRTDPTRLLPGARTVVAVAKNYYAGGTSSDDPAVGIFARYARGDDYHDVVRSRLEDLRRFIENAGGRAKACVDTDPILEKLWAVRAGIGWQGKHSIVMAEEYSSWLFVGEILTDLELPSDGPGRNRCGECTRCIDGCPTRAIVSPYVVDARRCLAYLTIEHRGSIPLDLRPLMSNRIFGCDICQEACPWVRRSVETAAFRPRPGLEAPRLADLLAMTDRQFEERFRGSPVRRAGRAGLLRNVCVALGNSGDRSALAPLTRAMKDPEPLVREHAAWALKAFELSGAR